jgi:hypothetical protein
MYQRTWDHLCLSREDVKGIQSDITEIRQLATALRTSLDKEDWQLEGIEALAQGIGRILRRGERLLLDTPDVASVRVASHRVSSVQP